MLTARPGQFAYRMFNIILVLSLLLLQAPPPVQAARLPVWYNQKPQEGTPTPQPSGSKLTSKIFIPMVVQNSDRVISQPDTSPTPPGTDIPPSTLGSTNQTITVSVHAPATAVYATTFTISATASSGLAVVYASGSQSVCTNSGATFTMVSGTGTCLVYYDQPGDATYAPAPQVTENVSAAKVNQKIIITAPYPQSLTYPSQLTRPAQATSNLPVTFSTSNSSVCTFTGMVLTMLSGTGECVARYDQAGNGNYNPASQKTEVIQAAKASQSITVTTHAPASAAYNTSFGVAATASSGLTVTYSSGSPTVCTNSGASFTMVKSTGGCIVRYDQAGDNNYLPASQITETVTATKADQTITFGALSTKTLGDPDFTVSAAASSGLAVSFGASGVCTLTGSTVHLTGTGACTITAFQAGDTNYNAAPNVPQSFQVKTAQTITVTTHAPASAAYHATFTVAATASSGLVVAYTSGSPSVCTNTGAIFTMVAGGGNCIVQYDQAGDATYGQAHRVTESVTAAKASQTISVTTHAPSTAMYNTVFTVAATASSGLAVAYSSGSTSVCTISSSTFTMVSGTGSCLVRYDQPGDANYNPATRITETVTAQKANQTITVTTHAPSTAAYNSGFSVAATASSGLPVTYSSGSVSVCTNNGAAFTMVSGTGNCLVQYDQAGNSNYSAASRVTESVTASKINQSITVTTHTPATAVYNASFTVAATASSGLPVTYSSGSPSVCTNTGATFTIISGAGSCSVKYNQAGNTNYVAAPQIVETVTLGKASQSITVTTHTPSSAGYNTSFTVAATASSGLAVVYSSGSPSVCTNTGATFTMINGTGNCIVHYDQAGDSHYSPASQVNETATAAKAYQTITVTTHAPSSVGNNSSFTVAATSSSGLTVAYSSGSSSICTNTDATFTILSSTGTCIVQYNQSGNSNYLAAPQVTETVSSTNTVSGEISSNTTWTLSNSPYMVTGSIIVDAGVTLTIEPGVVVKFYPATSLQINGTLVANGTSGSLIVFTSWKDDSVGGDSNGDGTATTAAPGDWSLIQIDGGTTTFDYTTIRYGGAGYGGALSATNAANLTLNHSILDQSLSYGIYLYGNQVSLTLTNSIVSNTSYGVDGYYCSNCVYQITNTTFTQNGNALYLTSTNSPVISNDVFTENEGVGYVYMSGGAPILSGNSGSNNSQNALWISGPLTDPTTLPNLPGLVYGLNITASSPVTIGAGVIVKMNSYSSFDAGLDVQGTANAPVVFTSWKDDSVGGDSNGDGTATTAAPGDWSLIQIDGGTTTFDYTTIRYGGAGYGGALSATNAANLTLNHSILDQSLSYGIYLYGNQVSLTLTNSIVSNTSYGVDGYYCSNCVYQITNTTFTQNGNALYLTSTNSPVISNDVFTENEGVGYVYMSGGAPILSGNSGSNNSQNALWISGPLTDPTTLPNLPGLVYGLNITASSPVTIGAGVIVKMNSYSSFDAGLDVQGTANAPVVFTSWKDDSVGGDSNGDGTATTAAPGDWSLIQIDGGTTTFDYTTIRYGGAGYGGALSATNAANLTLNHSILDQSLSYGIYLYGNQVSLTLTNSIISNTSDGVDGYSCTSCVYLITNSSFLNNGKGLALYSASSAVIRDNTFNGNTGTALLVDGNPPSPDYRNNTFTNNNYVGSVSIGSGPLLLSGNNGSGNKENFIGVSGTVSSATTLPYLPGLVYSGGLTANAPLTIQAGVIFKIATNPALIANQGLTVQGTANAPVVFTSWKDDSVGGDSNGDGTATTAAPGDWDGIYLNNSTTTLNNTYIRYGGGTGYSSTNSMINLTGTSSLVINSGAIEFSNSNGVYFSSTPVSIQMDHVSVSHNKYMGIFDTAFSPFGPYISGFSLTHCVFANNGAALAIRSGSTSTATATILTDNQFLNNGGDTYLASLSTPLTATGNTFSGNNGGFSLSGSSVIFSNNSIVNNSFVGAISVNGPLTFSGNMASGNTGNTLGIGGILTNPVTFPFIPSLNYGFGFNAQSLITIAAGVVVKQWSSSSVSFDGGLITQGTADAPVYFTSWKDDSVGGDSNGDGTATTATPGDWAYIQVSGTVVFDYTTIRYGGQYCSNGPSYCAVRTTDQTTLSMNHSTISDNNGMGLYLYGDGVSFTLANSTIANNGYGIWSPGSNPNSYYCVTCSVSVNITNSTFTNNSTALELHGVSSGSIHFNIFSGNSTGLFVDTTPTVDARYNYWGSNDGPSPFGHGDTISYYQINDPICNCLVIKPTIAFVPWLDSAGNTVGPKPVSFQGYPSSWATAWAAEPVNVVFGNYTYQYTDLSFPTRGEAFTFQRSYNSASTDTGPIGPGWTFSYNIKVSQTSSNTFVIQREDGRKDLYTSDGSGNYLAPPGIYDTLTWNTDHFVLTRKDRLVYTFNPDGTLASEADRNGKTTTFTYSSGNLTVVTEPDGRQVTFSYSGSLLTQIHDPLNRTVSFGYTAGRLTSVTDANGHTTTYAYDASGLLQSITDANGHTFVQNTYDSQGRVVQQYDAQNHLTTFQYDPTNRHTTVTDPLNHTTGYDYDTAYRIVAETDGLGHAETYTYDASNNRMTLTDRNSHTTRYTYDNRGNILTVTDAMNGFTAFTYNTLDLPLTQTDANNHTASYTYDASGNRLTATDASGMTTHYIYYSDTNRNGRLQTITDPLNHSTTFDYNSQGDPTQVTDALNQITTYTYDAGGRKLTFTDARSHTWTYTYDNLNHPLTETNPLNGTTTSTYDLVGNRLTLTDANGKTIHDAYNEKDQLVTVTDPGGYIITTTYDAAGNKTAVEDGNHHTTTFGYDAANRLVSITNPLNQTTSFGYDPSGNRTSVTDPLGHTTTTTYDALNRPTKVTDPLGHAASTTYDPVGNMLAVTDANNHTTTYTYDLVNHLQTVTDARNGVVSYAYDANGNRTSMTDANNHVTSYTYDELNRLITETDPLSHATQQTYDANGNRINTTDANGNTTTYSYDELNRLTTINCGQTSCNVSYMYDAVGNRLSMVDGLGTTTYSYDNLYRPLTIHTPTGGTANTYDAKNRVTLSTPAGTSIYAYDAADRMQAVTDWTSHTTVYTYDAAGRQATITYPNGLVTTNTYDNADRLTNITVRNGSTPVASISYTLDNAGNRLTMLDADGTTTYSYDKLNRLSTVVYPSGSPANVSYTYDPMGNRLTMVQDGVTTIYTYDAADRLITSITGGSTTNFTWDNNGNMLTEGSQTFTWDRGNHLVGLTNGGTTATYQYNGDGVRLGKTVNGVVTSFLQDLATGLPVVVHETTGAVTNDYSYGTDLISNLSGGIWSFYHYDGLGSTRLLTSLAGSITDRYSYDVFGTTRSHTGSSNQTFTYTGEQVDPEAGLVFLRTRYYNPVIGRFISKDNFPGLDLFTQSRNRYVYVQNNPIMQADPDGRIWNFIAGAAAGVLEYTIKTAVGNLMDGKPAFEGWDVGEAAISGAKGAIVYGLGLGPVGDALISGIADGATSAFKQYRETGHVDLTKVGIDGVVGGATSAVSHWLLPFPANDVPGAKPSGRIIMTALLGAHAQRAYAEAIFNGIFRTPFERGVNNLVNPNPVYAADMYNNKQLSFIQDGAWNDYYYWGAPTSQYK